MIEDQDQCFIVETDNKIIKNAIKELDANNNSYLSNGMESSDKNVEFLPKSLPIFLESLFVRQEKSVSLASIEQVIMQQVRQRTLIVFLQLGLDIQMHQYFGSTFLTSMDFVFHTVKF